jgi:hypothetical protein
MSLNLPLRFCALSGIALLNACGASPGGPLPSGAADQIVFTVQPSNAVVGTTIAPSVQVTFEDAAGHPVSNVIGSVTVAIGTDPNGGTLAGTVTVPAVNGVATFSTLSVSRPGVAYTLVASTPSLPLATSGAFNVSATTAAMLRDNAPTPQ